MAVVLFVVAFAMVVAGLAAIYDGYAIVMIEKGWTKVIAGAVGASAGFLLFGVVAVLAHLKRIAAGLEALRPPAGDFEAPSRQPPQSAEALAAGIDAALAASVPGPGQAPEVPISAALAEPSPQNAPTAPEPPPVQAPDEPAAPEPLRAPERRADSASEAPQAAPKPAAGQPPTVVGTYSSGGNTYVMYSDGSIQAQTPTGLFRFDTLDELKAFIAAGGEAVPPAR
jgi:outer membrane biosynthesis protein TonB